MTEVSIQRDQLKYLAEQYSSFVDSGRAVKVMDLEGNILTDEERKQQIAKINKRISERMTERLEYEEQIKQLIQSNNIVQQGH